MVKIVTTVITCTSFIAQNRAHYTCWIQEPNWVRARLRRRNTVGLNTWRACYTMLQGGKKNAFSSSSIELTVNLREKTVRRLSHPWSNHAVHWTQWRRFEHRRLHLGFACSIVVCLKNILSAERPRCLPAQFYLQVRAANSALQYAAFDDLFCHGI